MAIKVSRNAKSLSPSLTLALTAKAKAMQAEGIKIVSFGAGEPDFDTPEFVKQVAIDDLNAGATKYTAVKGRVELLKAVAETLRRDYGLEYNANTEIIVSVGGKHSLFNIFMAIIDPGDEVIIPAPYWLTYPEQVGAFGGKSVIVDCPVSQGFKMTAEQLRAAITPRTVAVVLNSPSNPTGAVYSAEELLALAEVLREAPHVHVISDDLYMKLVYAPAKFHSIVSLAPDLKDRSIIVNGLSKAYSMTGWRLGWTAAPAAFVKVLDNIQGQSTSNVTTFTQNAAAAALQSDHSFLKEWVATFDWRRNLLVDGLNAIPGITCDPAPEGAFYTFPDVSGLYGRELGGKVIKGSMDLSEVLLEKAQVSVVPGVAFGEDRCVRLSYATSEAVITEGLRRIREFVS